MTGLKGILIEKSNSTRGTLKYFCPCYLYLLALLEIVGKLCHHTSRYDMWLLQSHLSFDLEYLPVRC